MARQFVNYPRVLMGLEKSATEVTRHSRADEEARLRNIGEKNAAFSHVEVE